MHAFCHLGHQQGLTEPPTLQKLEIHAIHHRSQAQQIIQIQARGRVIEWLKKTLGTYHGQNNFINMPGNGIAIAARVACGVAQRPIRCASGA